MKIVRPITVTDTVLTSSSVAEPEAAWAVETTYAKDDVVRRTVGVVHRRFISAQNSNTGHDPVADDGTWWVDDGPTNRWAMFDEAIGTGTVDDDEIAVELTLPAAERVDTAAVLNVSAAQARIVQTDPVDGVVYDKTFSLTSMDGITDWWRYFTEPIDRLTDLVVTDLKGAYAGSTVDVTLTATGATVSVGALVCGMSLNLGGTRWGARLGIQDYSIKQRDDFGNIVVVERAYAKRASFDILVANNFVDRLQTQLARYRATPILYIGDPDYTSMAVYGFFKDFNVEVAYPDVSLCSLEVESLN